ncbi:MOSC domain-containing protein [Pigmentiphaga aceris]|uniref:MOSC domain-containing protein n=1 Tax=Pigmentiphaga aceris TaxID=1940612 RepID=A0A5C0AWD0_9BURK|nr:MOSC domain-containing protein [Pigmentiphaga aceris]QEI06046.1 MOSC domain-containing protein [Pigmentiphaga aceris]
MAASCARAASVVAVHVNPQHGFSKDTAPSIKLLDGLGVEGDAHCGVTVKHRSRVARDPFQPNLRQVHLIHAELFDELASQGFDVLPGDLGENITTQGIDLLALPAGTRLRLGKHAVVTLTGLRNPCVQIDRFKRGLMKAVLDHTPDGKLIRKAGVMGIVSAAGEIKAGDRIIVKLPKLPYRAMEPV